MKKDNTMIVDVLDKAIKLPGVKVNREEFLVKIFEDVDVVTKKKIIEEGPIQAGYSREEIRRIAKKLVNDRTLKSSAASFTAGLPGGLLMVGTITADTMQFYGMALRLIQELAYLYGDKDMINIESGNMEIAINRIILYCGVMLGVSGSSATLKLTASVLSKKALVKIPQKALTKTIYYPIIKKIATILGVRMNKEIFAKGVSKTVPVIGGFVSGGLTFASMRPMGFRVVEALDEVMFNYTEEDYDNDLEEVMNIIEADAKEAMNQAVDIESTDSDSLGDIDFGGKLREAKELLESGVITEEEFSEIKTKIIDNI